MSLTPYDSGPPSPRPLGCFGWSMIALFVVVTGGLLFPAVTICTDWSNSAAKLRWIARLQMSNLVTALKEYRIEYQSVPAGSTAQILRQLEGDNPKRIVFVETHARRVNAASELLDPWGMRYHFAGEAGGLPLVYSSGPDKQDHGGA